MGIVWYALAFAIPMQVWAATCSGADEYQFSFASRPTTQLAYGTTYTYTATRSAGGNANFSVRLTAANLSSTSVGGETMPRISTLVTGSAVRQLIFGGTFNGRTASITGTNRVITVTFNLPTPVVSFSVSATDIDYGANQFRDWVHITGSNGTSTFTPVMTTPWGNTNSGTSTAASSSIAFGVRAASPVLADAAQMAGIGASEIGADTGTFTARFAQPVTRIVLRYGNYPGESPTGQQAMGISGIAFCEMPSVVLTKTSAPAAGELGSFNVPGNDIVYTLTLTNPTGTSVDAGSLVMRDLLPPHVTFRNSPFDASTALPLKLVSSGGLALTSASLRYRQTGSTTFSYAPTSGYDPQVAELQVVPDGELAPNATAAFQFLARIE